MVARYIRRTPESFKAFAVALGLVVVGTVSTTGAGLASTDTHIDLSLAQYTESCQRAAASYMFELDKVMDMMDAGVSGPRLERHVDLMWDYYAIVVYDCGIDVSGWGDDHP